MDFGESVGNFFPLLHSFSEKKNKLYKAEKFFKKSEEKEEISVDIIF